MSYRPLRRFLFRAPLLPVRALRTPDALDRHPLGAAALAIASPDLASQGAGARARQALDRYRRRAAFRPTPSGLLAGVGLGALGTRTAFRTAAPAPFYRLRWQRVAMLARALLERPELRAATRLRRAPSVLLGAHSVTWLDSAGDEGIDEQHAELDDLLAAALDATAGWRPWPEVRASITSGGGDERGGDTDDDEALDEFLISMLDQGLLQCDLVPPLVGARPDVWLRRRLAGVAAAGDAAGAMADAVEALEAGDWRAVTDAAAAWPGAAAGVAAVDATLVFDAPAATLSRAAVARAASVVPLLFRLQEALAPPVSERTPAPALADALDATTEIFGAGAVNLAAFARGDYGVDPADGERTADGAAVGAAVPLAERGLLTYLVDRLQAAARARVPEVALRAEELEPLLPDGPAPPTCELFLTPGRTRPGRPPGTGWLLGLHAPGGASWGRFAFALGSAAHPLLDDLRQAEERARPGERALDVVFSPGERLADLCCHPPVRSGALALGGWPDENQTPITVADLELVADPAALEPLSLRSAAARLPVAPVALHRVRSTLAPPGVWRLLAGWSLHRQHAPWATTLGPLGDLGFTPRLSLEGFVIAPASWAVPSRLGNGHANARALAAWRREAGVPRVVQVGREDELLPVDLAAPSAAADLAGARRVFEIWPPLGDTPDRSGRRLEAVVALAAEPDDAEAAMVAAAVEATVTAGPVGPPAVRARGGQLAGDTDDAAGWLTFKVFGGADRQDHVLLASIQPAVRAGRAAGELTGWFFLRYVEGPGRRNHLRLRVRVRDRGAAGETAFARRLDEHLQAAVADGDVVAVERAPYYPEASRYGGPAAMPAVHRLFGADSDLCCGLLALLLGPDDALGLADEPDGRAALLACTFDAFARGLGLDAAERRALAARRLAAHGADSVTARQEQGRAFRRLGPRLRGMMGAPSGALGQVLSRFEKSVQATARSLAGPGRARALPPLLHMAAVRLAGPDAEVEVLAHALWERTLESLAHHGLRARGD